VARVVVLRQPLEAGEAADAETVAHVVGVLLR
jgi:hypothetical protein